MPNVTKFEPLRACSFPGGDISTRLFHGRDTKIQGRDAYFMVKSTCLFHGRDIKFLAYFTAYISSLYAYFMAEIYFSAGYKITAYLSGVDILYAI